MCERNQTSALPRNPMFDREVEGMRAAARASAGCDTANESEHGVEASDYYSRTACDLRQRREQLQARMRLLQGKLDTIDLVLDVFVD